MTEPLSFTPLVTDLWLAVAACLALVVVFIVVGWRLSTAATKDPRQKVVLPMLLYFAAMLAFMGAAGNGFSILKYPTITIQGRRIAIDGEEFPMPRKDALRMERASGGLGGENHILLLRVASGKTYALPEDRYDLVQLQQALRK